MQTISQTLASDGRLNALSRGVFEATNRNRTQVVAEQLYLLHERQTFTVSLHSGPSNSHGWGSLVTTAAIASCEEMHSGRHRHRHREERSMRRARTHMPIATRDSRSMLLQPHTLLYIKHVNNTNQRRAGSSTTIRLARRTTDRARGTPVNLGTRHRRRALRRHLHRHLSPTKAVRQVARLL